MDAYQAIITKRDTRLYLPDQVKPEHLDKVLRAARMAGSAKNSQLTRLVVVQDQATRTALTECGDFTSWIDTAPTVIVVAAPTETKRLFDLGRMSQNLMIAANALGLATCPVTFQHQNRIREVLGIPEDFEGLQGITLGYPKEPEAGQTATGMPRSPRLPLEELVHYERW